MGVIVAKSSGSVLPRIVRKPFDLSSQCNDSNMVFTLPTGFISGSVTLMYSSFPWFFRPNIDFTEIGGDQIQLTTGVTPPATGQTLIGEANFYE